MLAIIALLWDSIMKTKIISFFDTQDYIYYLVDFYRKLVASDQLVYSNKEYWTSQFDLFCDGNRGPLMHDSSLVILTDIFRRAGKI
jgi:hypothetical protein